MATRGDAPVFPSGRRRGREPEPTGRYNHYGQVKLALLNEILGRSECAPIVFGSQAPDSGNSEILARYGTPELKARYLEPLLDNRIVSCFSMTEPQGASDPSPSTTWPRRRSWSAPATLRSSPVGSPRPSRSSARWAA